MVALAALQERQEENVHSLKNYEINKVFNSFISLHTKNSERTAEEYSSRVNEFFQMTLGKNVNFVTLDEIKGIKKADVQTLYIDKLVERGNKFNSIQTKLNSVRSFYNEMLANTLEVNPMIFKVKLPKDVTHHESLERPELEMLFEFMKNQKELAMEKYLLVKMLFTTANRKTATMGISKECGMTWEDNFSVMKDRVTGEEINVVKIIDKGQKEIEKPISKEFYDELQQINKGQKYVFEISPKTIQRALNSFSKVIGRKITVHSLKATAITLGYQMTKDIELCRQLGGHSSIMTTEIYIREEKSLISQLSYNMSKELDDSLLDSLSHSELLDFIKSNEDIRTILLTRLDRKSI